MLSRRPADPVLRALHLAVNIVVPGSYGSSDPLLRFTAVAGAEEPTRIVIRPAIDDAGFAGLRWRRATSKASFEVLPSDP